MSKGKRRKKKNVAKRDERAAGAAGGSQQSKKEQHSIELQNLKEMFPSIEAEIVEMVYQASEKDIEKTLQHLQSMVPPEDSELNEIQRAIERSERAYEKGEASVDEGNSITSCKESSSSSSSSSNPSSLKSSSSKLNVADATSFICSIFNNIDAEVVKKLLEENDNDVERTVESLLSVSFISEEQLDIPDLPEELPSEEISLRESAEIQWIEDMNKHLAERVSSLTKEIDELKLLQQQYGYEDDYYYNPPAPRNSKKKKDVPIPTASLFGSAWAGKNPITSKSGFVFQAGLGQLREMFPDAPPAELACALESHNDDLQATIESLLQGTNPPLASSSSKTQAPATSAVSTAAAKKPSPTTNNGKKGKGTKLILPFDPSEAVHANEWKEKKPDGDIIGQDLSSRLKFNNLHERFWWIDVDILESVYHSNNMNIDKTVETLLSLYPSVGEMMAKATSTAEAETGIPSSSTVTAAPSKIIVQKVKKAERPLTENEVIATRFGLNILPTIHHLRKQVIQEAKLRSAFYRQAARAYATGDGKLAKELSLKGREHDLRMSEALKTFVAATTKTSSSRQERLLKVDLHGLHVKESLEVLEELLIAYRKAFESTGDGPRYLYVITGLGLHSQDHRARIRPAVIEYLKQHKYKYFDNGGVVVVKLWKGP